MSRTDGVLDPWEVILIEWLNDLADREGFFHPDGWTFGQNLLASQILGRVQSVKGIGHVRSLEMKRFNEVTPGKPDRIEVQIHEIIQVENDPDHQEKGVIAFDIKGGRQWASLTAKMNRPS